MKFKEVFEARERSKNYQFTHVPGDPDTEEKMNQLKTNISLHNKTAAPDEKLRINKMPRLGRDNPNAHLYARGKYTYREASPEEAAATPWGDYRRLVSVDKEPGPLARTHTVHVDHAARTDVYVQKDTRKLYNGWKKADG